MREIHAPRIADVVAQLCIEANLHLGHDMLRALQRASEAESSRLGKELISNILENARIADDDRVPLCQDCGVAVLFLEIGQDVHITGGTLIEAVNEGVRRGYKDGYLRMSVVSDPLGARTNTSDNTPAVVHTEVVPGDRLSIAFMPKGGGSENMSRMRVLTPAEGRRGVIRFVVEAVEEAGGSPCPPIIVGCGVGGTTEKAAYLAKKSLLRDVGLRSPDPGTAELEADILEQINRLGIGPLGLGGRVTALAVHLETHPCHMASLPVAVNIQCHSARHRRAVL